MSDSPCTGDGAEPSPQEIRAKDLTSAALVPEDFYYEDGLVVFTAVYHLKRGYCCNSGCRHCPFR